MQIGRHYQRLINFESEIKYAKNIVHGHQLQLGICSKYQNDTLYLHKPWKIATITGDVWKNISEKSFITSH